MASRGESGRFAGYHAAGVLTFAEREALELRFAGGLEREPVLSWSQVGLALGISRAAARDRVRNGLRKIAAAEEAA